MRIKEMIEPTREALDCETNSPSQYIKRYRERSWENMHTYVRV